jgi:RES domain-containing protein
MLSAWRIVKAKYAANAFSGQGARQDPGRWNSLGIPVVYTAGSQALAALEMLVHIDDSDLLSHYRLIRVMFDETMVFTGSKALPTDWNRRSPLRITRSIGDQWARTNRSAVMQIPSVIVPGECNFLLNPLHPDFSKLSIGKPEPFRFDPRLR